MDRFERSFYKIRIITPVHIGSGEELDPFNYVIKDGRLHFINRDLFIEYLELEDKYREFLEISSSSSPLAIIYIRKFIRDNFIEELSMGSLGVSGKVEREYEDRIESVANIEIDGSKIINMLSIESMVHPGSDIDAIVPGSSLKGSIRTAVLDYIVKNQNHKKYTGKKADKRNWKKYKEQILELKRRDTSDDPFRALKISDFEISSGGTYVDECLNVKKDDESDSRGRGIPVKMEFFKPGTELVGTASIDTDANVSRPFENGEGLTHDNIFRSCRVHYNDSFEFEKKQFGISIPALDDINGNAAPIKIGKHSGAYAVTLHGYRDGNIKNRAQKKSMDHQSTTWLAGGKQVGWAILELIEEDEYQAGAETARNNRENLIYNLKKKKENILKASRERELKKQKEAERKRREKEKKKRERERIKTLPPEEWAPEVIDKYASDYNQFCDYIQNEENPRERREELTRVFFTETLKGKKKLKDYKKKLRKGTAKKTILLAKELAPKLFEE